MSASLTGLPIDNNFKGLQQTYNNVQSSNKNVTTAGTAVQLSATTLEAKRLDVTARYDNTDMVVVGGSGVVGAQSGRKGVPIAPGNTYTFFVTDLSKVYIDSVVSGEGVSFNYFW